MLSWAPLLVTAVLSTVTSAASLSSVCTSAYAKAALPADAYPGITIDTTSVTAAAYYNESFTSVMYPNAIIDYCNVTFAYSHNGRDDQVLVTYWLPAPAAFQNRFLATGGGGLAINSGNSSVAGGIPYGAASGLTDGGFGGFDNEFDSVFLLANNTINWEEVYLFGYQAIHEMTVIGKAFTMNFFNSNATKLYTYYQACSEGGREGFSQVQRFAETYDGAIIGAPAFRYGFQQVNHLTSNIVEQTMGYYPPPCELQKIVNETITFCDPLDGKTDGVVSRTDLCKLQFNVNSTIGKPYSCAATAASMMGAAAPAQNGTVTAQGAAVAAEILKGLHDNDGRRVYLPYQYSATFTDAETEYDSTTGKWILDQSGLGGEWVERFLHLQDADLIPSLANVTYDTLKEWMLFGTQKYIDSLQATYPDLTAWEKAGRKILHFHGESDYSVPTASSVRYRESVRQIMYPHLSYNASSAALNSWYRFYSVPGAGHCSTNTAQPNGPWPQTNLQVMIDWVEKGIEPTTLNATILQGDYIGENAQICAWPLRPLWTSNSSSMECVYDQKSLDTWVYDFDAVKIPVY